MAATPGVSLPPQRCVRLSLRPRSKRIPRTGDLLAVWNDHSQLPEAWRAVDASHPDPQRPPASGLCTPLTIAISRDEGKTWEHAKNIETDPAGWYCYTAMEFTGERVLLGYAPGGSGLSRLSRSVVKVIDLSW